MRLIQVMFRAAALALAFAVALPVSADDSTGRGDPRALDALQRMSEFLASTKQFTVAIETGYDIVQESGQKLEFGENREVRVRRPDRIRVDATHRDGSGNSLYFDGREIAYFDTDEKVYATASRPGDIDGAISYFVDDLGMHMPMASILSPDLPQIVKDWAREISYVEQSTIRGVACDHVAMRGSWEDVQMWIARGDRPLLQRLVITYTRAEGRPQFWAQFGSWDLSPAHGDSVFVFAPPAGAAKISFAAGVEHMQPGGAQPAGARP